MKRRALAWGFVLVLAALLVAGLVRLFHLRQTGGDLYPPYSSLRSDPLGIKALYLALEELGLDVHRNYRPWRWVQADAPATWLMVGVKRADFLEEWAEHGLLIEALAQNGGRLVIAFAGELTPPSVNWGSLWRKLNQAGKVTSESHAPLEERWQFQFAHQDLSKQEDETFLPATARRVPALADWPQTLDWRSALVFTNHSPAWRVLYAVNNAPVVMERSWGRGTIVLLSDSYLLSNEAMRFHRVPPLLAWLVGRSARVVFNETHLGVVEQPGMGNLLRQYRLQGVAAVLLLLALLYIWQNSFPLAPLPQKPSAEQAAYIQGRDTMMGLVHLLRRGIPPRRVLRICLEHWKETAGRNADATVLAEMEARVNAFEQTPARLANPVAVYAELARLAAEKRRHRKSQTPAAPKNSSPSSAL
ncbi:DUF4350 domain-containing protein [Fontisphaera persica]|uniref:DUF4350 domain-containing protein n=1 Tax=Fontisphaera persica TaxID=2974023 RepID=UPI0024C0D0D0|nr:DUF4350 domain-containing protein [Fontisphaera persica]WCJ60851.1 DUF4350 domain-containing protein [Fontisphaera persica]